MLLFVNESFYVCLAYEFACLCDPILSCEEAAQFEYQFFKGEPHEWLVMQTAGRK